ncbi:MAG: DUF427 domain-containing protein, partial [Saprospiraceae bacterium]|nr:DUF427 domain-containing protein [Saprospiraceae bacterium]
MKKKAIWNGETLAESDDLVNVEGNYYFPESSINKEFFQPSDTETMCPWKGMANYYSIKAGGKENTDAAWYYADPKEAASK